ncbi:MAG: FAD-binding oxidoreductase [Blastomonas sp.]
MLDYDVAIIGAGIAGASLAAELAPHMRVLLVEAEDQPGYHATGRSAAFWAESYGGPDVQPLTTASGPWLLRPPSDISDRSFLAPRGALTLARADQRDALQVLVDMFAGSGVRMERWDREAIEAKVPGVSSDIVSAVYEPDCQDIDVGGLHNAWLASARRAGVTLALRAPLTAARSISGGWQLTIGSQQVSAGLLANAAGAWADEVAGIAGIDPVGIRPFRRTIVQLRTDPAPAPDLPLTLGIGGDYYFKPEAGRLWLSPHDEIPSPPCDSAPEEIDIALAIERFGEVVDWRIEAVERRWAGLRSFAPDRLPVIGFAPQSDRFFWFAGQGGFGIQTAPAAASMAGSIITGQSPSEMIAGIEMRKYDPCRFG